MNDSPRTTVGRPRLYENSSQRLDAFRARLESAGYIRKEVLVTKDTAQALSDLAKAHQVTVTDAASALLEYGLQTFRSNHRTEGGPVSYASSVSANGGLCASVGASTAVLRAVQANSARSDGDVASSANSPKDPQLGSDNPITRFFANRRQETKK